ncbi:hypothetical protein TrVFT333_006001 [Trichoderma virens FT-333]|nr:hypothetical protein TrVFT333_006001 [Trichoderma virens FT-333]
MARESFNLSGLPFEIRTLIWEATLPPTRIFHVKGTTESGINSKILTFHRKHPPPIALHICTESRAAALRNGDYFLASEPGTGPWFNPKRDILYFDRNQRHMLRSQGGKTRISGWEKVLHVGLEWRAWFRDVPRQTAPGDEDIRRHWRSVRAFTTYSHAYGTRGVTWGREPYKSAQYEAQLVHLPEATEIPWAGAGMGIRNAIHNGAAAGNAAPGVLVIPGATEGSRTLLTMTTWGDIKVDMERALEEELKGDEEDQVVELDWTLANEDGEDGEDEDEDNSKCVFPGNQPPEVVGWWLLRQDAPREDHPSIREFFV